MIKFTTSELRMLDTILNSELLAPPGGDHSTLQMLRGKVRSELNRTDNGDDFSLLSDTPVDSDRWSERSSPKLRAVLDALPGTVRVRTEYALRNRGVETFAQLIALTLSDLRKTRNLGKQSVAGIRSALAKFGLELSP